MLLLREHIDGVSGEGVGGAEGGSMAARGSRLHAVLAAGERHQAETGVGWIEKAACVRFPRLCAALKRLPLDKKLNRQKIGPKLAKAIHDAIQVAKPTLAEKWSMVVRKYNAKAVGTEFDETTKTGAALFAVGIDDAHVATGGNCDNAYGKYTAGDKSLGAEDRADCDKLDKVVDTILESSIWDGLLMLLKVYILL